MILRQAIMHATDAGRVPENIDKKIFILEFALKDDPQIALAAEDRYRLVKGEMFPKDKIIKGMQNDRKDQLMEYIGAQDVLVKGRGQLGVVPVLMQLENSSVGPSWLPLALPCTQKEAQKALKACGWKDVYWVSWIFP
jgi:hypothetical protein